MGGGGDAGRAAEGWATGGISELGRAMGSTQSTQSNPSIPPQLYPFVQQGFGEINNLQVPNVTTPTPWSQAFQQFGNSQFGPGGSVNNANSLYNNILSGKNLDPNSNPYLQKVLDTSLSQFNKGLSGGLDQLSSQFQLAGQSQSGSGQQQGQATNLTERALSDYGNNVGNMLFGNYQQGVGQQMQALMGGNPAMGMAQNAFGIANLPQEQQLQQFQLNQVPIQLLMQMLGTTGGLMGQTQYGPSPFAQNFGMLMQGMQGAGSLMQGFGAL